MERKAPNGRNELYSMLYNKNYPLLKDDPSIEATIHKDIHEVSECMAFRVFSSERKEAVEIIGRFMRGCLARRRLWGSQGLRFFSYGKISFFSTV